jgi:hypothetical protein
MESAARFAGEFPDVLPTQRRPTRRSCESVGEPRSRDPARAQGVQILRTRLRPQVRFSPRKIGDTAPSGTI